jgi:hypothetical protein
MTVSLAIALNAIADVALLGGLTWFMTRPAKLTPHVPAAGLSVVPAQAERFERAERLAA